MGREQAVPVPSNASLEHSLEQAFWDAFIIDLWVMLVENDLLARCLSLSCPG